VEIQQRKIGDSVVLAPIGRLVLGGPAEEYEERTQAVLAAGVRMVVTDLREVTHIDSTGIRSVIRGYTSAQRLSAGFRLAGMTPVVRMVMQVTHLDTVIPMFETVEGALGDSAGGSGA
jgi:anti-sigma B factor antagonist